MTKTYTPSAHAVLVRYEGLKDPRTGEARIADERYVPVRLTSDGQYCIRRRGHLLPVHAIDADGAARVRIAQEGLTTDQLAIARMPVNADGHWDFDALEGHAPVIANPWEDEVLKHAKTYGDKPVAKPKASKAPKGTKAPVASEPAPAPTALRVNLRNKPAEEPKAQPKATKAKAAPAPAPAAPQLDQQAVIAYLAGLSSADSAALIAALQAAKAQPKAGRKGR